VRDFLGGGNTTEEDGAAVRAAWGRNNVLDDGSPVVEVAGREGDFLLLCDLELVPRMVQEFLSRIDRGRGRASDDEPELRLPG